MFWGIVAWLGGGVFCFVFRFRKLLERARQPEKTAGKAND